MSDQDFFFDEDEKADEEVAEKPARKQASGKPAPRQTAARQSAAGYGGGQSVTMTVAALIAVVALLVGVIIGILIPAGASTTTPSPAASDAGSMTAPQLSDEQIQSGVMPEGHPPISGAEGMTGTVEATGTTE